MPTMLELANRGTPTYLCTLLQRNGMIVRVPVFAFSVDGAIKMMRVDHPHLEILSVVKLLQVE